MNKEVVVITHLSSSKVACSASSHTEPSSTSFSDTAEASLTGSAETEYFHPLLEVEASEGSRSRNSIKSYDT